MLSRTRDLLLSAAAAFALSAVPASAQMPSGASDGEWLSLTGTVEAVSGDNFVLDYGKNSITVEMDDFDWYDENSVIVGDEVIVTGRMDNDFLQSRRIEASSVYIDSIHTRYYASSADEEDFLPAVDGAIVSDASMTVTGTVEAITGDEIIVDAAYFDYKVDAGALNYDPFDASGLQHIEVGDRISVTGKFDDSDFFDSPEIDATFITELSV